MKKNFLAHKVIKNPFGGRVVVAHSFNPSIWEEEAGERLWVLGQPGLLR